jgi:hypothetical protein
MCAQTEGCALPMELHGQTAASFSGHAWLNHRSTSSTSSASTIARRRRALPGRAYQVLWVNRRIGSSFERAVTAP